MIALRTGLGKPATRVRPGTRSSQTDTNKIATGQKSGREVFGAIFGARREPSGIRARLTRIELLPLPITKSSKISQTAKLPLSDPKPHRSRKSPKFPNVHCLAQISETDYFVNSIRGAKIFQCSKIVIPVQEKLWFDSCRGRRWSVVGCRCRRRTVRVMERSQKGRTATVMERATEGGTAAAVERGSSMKYGKGVGATGRYTYDGEDVILDDGSEGVVRYLNGPGIDNKLRMESGGAASYFLADHLGSTNGLTDANGNLTSQAAYDSFGNQTGNIATRYGFTGRERDDFTGLMHYRARQYDPNLGRFISEDPIGFAGGDVNLYAYVRNRPIDKTDPHGETEEGMIWRLQYHQDPATRPHIAKWDSCSAKCVATYGAAQAAGFVGMAFGQPMNPKPFVTPGSSPGTSPISQWLSEAFPQRFSRRVWAPTFQHPFATSNVAGRVAGRWTPIGAAAMMAVDFGVILSCTNECYNNGCTQ